MDRLDLDKETLNVNGKKHLIGYRLASVDARNDDDSGTAIVPSAVDAVSRPVNNRLKYYRKKARGLVNAERDRRLNGGFAFNGVVFDSDARSIQRIALLAMLSSHNRSYSTNWVDKHNRILELEASDILELGRRAFEHEEYHIFAARQAKDAIMAAESRADIDRVVQDYMRL